MPPLYGPFLSPSNYMFCILTENWIRFLNLNFRPCKWCGSTQTHLQEIKTEKCKCKTQQLIWSLKSLVKVWCVRVKMVKACFVKGPRTSCSLVLRRWIAQSALEGLINLDLCFPFRFLFFINEPTNIKFNELFLSIFNCMKYDLKVKNYFIVIAERNNLVECKTSLFFHKHIALHTKKAAQLI